MADNDSIPKTLAVALSLCVVCSVVVSTAAVMLKPMQERNVAQDRKRNILAAAGMYDEARDIDRQFEQITARVVELGSGRFSADLDPETFDQAGAARDPALSEPLVPDADTARIGRRESHAVVYLVGEPSRPDVVILPVRGAGLWGPMNGFLALERDLDTVAGLGFYEHKETPGLGGEVDNPRWRGLWPGKRAFDDSGAVALTVLKGVANRNSPSFTHRVDGLSGATLTSRGVNNIVQFWMGENGFGPFLARLKAGEA